jgi:FkbM family methyltransferase
MLKFSTRVAGLIDRWFIKQPKFRRALTRLIVADHDLEVALFGTSIQINTRKEHGYFRAFRKVKSSSLLADEAGVIVSLATILEDGDTFVDVGANVGIFVATLARAQYVWPATRFYAFEANPDTYKRLCKTVTGLNVDTFELALSDHDGELTFVEGAVSHVFTAVAHATTYNIPNATRKVRCARLDTMPIHGDSIILKIDVEGQEEEVLRGAETFFAESRIKAVYLDGYNSEKVPGMLRNWGFTFHDGRSLRPLAAPGFSLLAIKH